MMRVTYILFLLFTFYLTANAQIHGRITDGEGNALAFASIYVKGSTKGTSSNLEGNYELNLTKGSHRIIFQYLGYQSHEELVEESGLPQLLNVVLKPSVYNLREIIISSIQEDPAYEIIRKAMSRREFFLNQRFNYTCDAYTKGYLRILGAPKKILGREIGSLDGNLDTNRKGFVYLSETVSKITFEKPNHLHEEMISSIVSGKDNGFSFNSASSVNFNLYENTNEFGKNIISPVSSFALAHYQYKLLGIDTSADLKHISYRIQLFPKNKNQACWYGEINIRDGDWSIESANLYILGKQVQQELFDTIYLKQLFIPVEHDQLYEIQNQVFSFNANFLGIKLEGKFVVVFSDYRFNKDVKIENKNVLLQIREGANENGKTYWDSIRPVPLTVDERLDYMIKDSIKVVRESKGYKDSIDANNNKFKWTNVLLGYDYRNSYKRWNFSIGSPLELFHFNPVQGWSLGTTFNYNQSFKRLNGGKHLSANVKMDYGFSEMVFRPSLKLHYAYNHKVNSFVEIAGGSGLFEFNSYESSKLFNEVDNLYFKTNFVKYYEKTFAKVSTGNDISNDLSYSTELEYSRRQNVVNHSFYSFVRNSEPYQANAIADRYDDSLLIKRKDHIRWTSRFSWTPQTKVWVTPKGNIKVQSDYPSFDFDYTIGMYTQSQDIYHRLGLTVSKTINLGKWGVINLTGKGAALLYKSDLDTPERIFQIGNNLDFDIKPNENVFFMSLNSYAYSTSRRSASFFIEHDFQGLFLDRIPLINRLRLKELLRYSMVCIPGSTPFTEVSFGLGNIGYKLFRILRVDIVHQFYEGKFKASYFKVGLTASLGGGN
jgi:hypothetical protein